MSSKVKFINSYEKLGEEYFSRTKIEAFDRPELIDVNYELAAELDLELNDQEYLEYFSGNKNFDSSVISTVYAGHQFGSYVPQLGDGRAHLLGEIENIKGETFELQLKGSGKTPYSRFGDGKAVLRSSIREYLASEALHHIGIPTTRALCLIGSDENVMREGMEKAAMVTRVSPSFIRFGHFEFFTHSKKPEQTKILADYVIDKFYPQAKSFEDKYEKFFYEIVIRNAELVAKWQAFGFAHGVLNTDNMSILGLSIDYGPYGFLDNYHLGFIPNHSDYSGRYSFGHQPQIIHWNLYALANALTPVLPLDKSGEVLQLFGAHFLRSYIDLMREKIGLKQKKDTDKKLIQDLLHILAEQEIDYTIFFRKLCDYRINGDNSEIYKELKKVDIFKEWESHYQKRLLQEVWPDLNKNAEKAEEERSMQMKKVNPKYILRNYLAETAIKQATFVQDYSEIKKLRKILQHPFDEQPEYEPYASSPPEWARGIELSCSS